MLGWHLPLTHEEPPPHACPQLPQFSGSLPKSAQQPATSGPLGSSVMLF